MVEPPELCISNVGVFDSVDAKVTGPMDVTVRDGLVASVAAAGSAEPSSSAAQIDGTGKTLLPGPIDAHWHALFTTIPAAVAQLSEIGYVFARAVVSARETLLRGFTTVRDLGGPVFRNAELLAMSGPRNPYPGRLGVVAEGALADLILIDGNPVADISLIARPDEAFTVTVKDGRLVKGGVPTE